MSTQTKEKYSIKRVRYFDGMFMTEGEFKDEQEYHNQKRALLNRMLRGWGVVCGLNATIVPDSSTISITPGLALDCEGHEIWVKEEAAKDLSDLQAGTYYIAIEYQEEDTPDTSKDYSSDKDCAEEPCKSSRIGEYWNLRLLAEKNIPKCHKPPFDGELTEKIKMCMGEDFEDEEEQAPDSEEPNPDEVKTLAVLTHESSVRLSVALSTDAPEDKMRLAVETIRASADPSTEFVHLDRLGFVFCATPTDSVQAIAEMEHVQWVDLDGESSLDVLVDG